VFIPFFSGITDTAPAYHLDGDTYNPDGAFWKFKSICTIAEQNRSLYSQGVKDFWKLQEELMYQEMLDAAPAMLAKYSESRAAGDAYVTQLGIDMAEREMLLADNLYAKLLTTMMHNTGLSSSKTPTTFLSDVPLRQVAESRGYTVTWNKADGSTTIAKGDVTYTFTPESYECVTGTGETIELTHYCYVRDGFTYIPMDFAKTL
jgi:dipeptidase